MILIIGSSHDDVLYFESKIRNKHEELLLKRFPFITGTMFSQKIGIVYNVYTNYLSSTVVSSILAKHYVVLIINVGRCKSYSNDIKNGEIAISKQVYLGEVNKVGVENAILGQIPGFPQYYQIDSYVLELLTNSINKVLRKASYRECSYISIEKNLEDKKHLGFIAKDNIVFGITKDLVIDDCCGGGTLASYCYDIPFIAIKAVDGAIGEKRTLNDYVELLKRYSDIGKAVTSFIGEISRNEVIIGDK